MSVLVTGAAGFIGMHVAMRLLRRGDHVIGVDNLNDYYDVSLKQARLAQLEAGQRPGHFRFMHADVADRKVLADVFERHRPSRVIHLAAQVGVRNSVANPVAYVDANLVGFGNVLEECRKHSVEHLVYASSSSVYGSNTRLPSRESDGVDHPMSLYAATKKANELMAHAYSQLYSIPTTGLRFFTVYGPWGRPDMAPFLFANAIARGQPIDVFSHGRVLRDFTYIDDVAECVLRVCDKPAAAAAQFDSADPNPAISSAPYRIFNIGNSASVLVVDFIAAMEHAFGRSTDKRFVAAQPGDVLATAADCSALDDWIGCRPQTPIATGLQRFAEWYSGYFQTASI